MSAIELRPLKKPKGLAEGLVFLFLIAFACSSFAQVPIAQSGLSAALIAKAEASVFILDDTDEYCTVSPLSRDGYMLTALHCVRQCILDNKMGDDGNVPFAHLQDLFVSRGVGAVCKSIGIPALGIKGVTVVATGTALTSFDSQFMSAFPSLFKELQAHGFDRRANDYAILKITPPRPLDCFKTAQVANGAQIYALGYPIADKPVLSSSAGIVYSSAIESRAYQAATSDVDRAFYTEQYSADGVLYSSAANQFGQSGGPIVDANGNLVGVVSGFTMLNDLHELVGSKASWFLKDLSPALLAKISCK